MDPDQHSVCCGLLTDSVAAVDATPGSSRAAVRHPFCLMCDIVDDEMSEPLPTSADGLPAALRVPLRAGARLFGRGTRGQAIYIVQSGLVKEVVPASDGSERIVRLVAHGGVSGLGALLGEPHHHTAYVMHAGYACRIPVERLAMLRARDPHALDRLFADWQAAIDDADRIIVDLAHGPSRTRLARALLALRGCLAQDEALRLRRDDLAELMGISAGSVARLLGDFRREGLIVQQRRYCVAIDRKRLELLARAGA